ncbi:MAG: hypothetical protein ACQESR_22105 [Planctomycetota bacterium]
MESRPTQAVLPLVGLAADNVIRDRSISGGWTFPGGKLPDASRPPVGRTRGGQRHPRPVHLDRVHHNRRRVVFFSDGKATGPAPFRGWSDLRRRMSLPHVCICCHMYTPEGEGT